MDKPAGLLAVPGRVVSDSVPERLARLLARSVHVVHRLDMETSGLMVVALDAEAQRALSVQFERREVAKGYVAIVEGRVASDEGEIDLPMRADLERRPLQVVDFERGRAALTRWRVLSGERGGRTRVALEPVTGRTHQLRVHAATPREVLFAGERRAGGLGSAIVGDSLYGARGERLLLHAATLGLRVPGEGTMRTFRSGVPF